jgi:hypothetical protein
MGSSGFSKIRKGVEDMASDFRMRFLRRNGKLCIKLKGDLDGSSVKKVFNALRRNRDDECEILVDTTGLRRVYCSGREVFKDKMLRLHTKPSKFTFVGGKRAKLTPEEI